MSGFFPFLKSKQFFIHFVIIITTICLVLFCLSKWLSSYTNHGNFVEVPNFKGQQIANLKSFITDKNISFQIIDSIYDPKEKPGVVIRQEPEEKSKVKHNRTIYLYVTGMVAPQVQMPSLLNKSEIQAKLIIQTYGLKIGKITPIKADNDGYILAQTIKGVNIEPGKGVKKGSTIDLVVGVKNPVSVYNNVDTISTKEPNFDEEPE